MTLSDMSLMGSLMILVIWAARTAVLNKLPRRTFVVLWLLAAARLTVPWQVTSPVSVYRLFEVPEAAPVTAAGGVSAMQPAVQQTSLPAAAVQQASAVPADPWSAVWWLGFILCAGIAAVVYFKWLRRFSESLPADSPEVQAFIRQHPLRRRLAVRTSVYVTAPLTYGVLRPVILLPASVTYTDDRQLEYVLTHEYVHIRHFDALLKLVFTAVCCVHWFNPFVWIMYVLAARDMELACDESVVARCGGRAEYARMLIGLEAERSGYILPGMSWSAGAARERITSIMKIRKKSVLTLLTAGALVAGICSACATSAPQADRAWSEVVEQDAIAMEDGTEEAWAAGGDSGIEWWTADEYAAWLEHKKAELQSILGSKSWSPSEGEYVWTQERIDEAIARYEQILKDIRGGALVRKSANGDGSIMLMQAAASQESAEAGKDYIDPELFKAYAEFGLTAEADGPVYNGEKVRYFEDAVEIEPGITASKTTFFTNEGTAFLRTVRQQTQNSDGSTDPFGQLIGIERIPDDEKKAILESLTSKDVTVVDDRTAAVSEDVTTLADLAPYAAFGLQYEPAQDGGLLMQYDGRAVHSLFDPVTGTWFASNMHGYSLGAARVDLEAVYADGRLSGLRVLPEAHNGTSAETSYAVEASGASGTSERGRSFDEVFTMYESLGLTSRTVTSPDGSIGFDLFFQGKPVNHFADVSPSGSAFSFDSTHQAQDGLTLHVVYTAGVPTRIEVD